MTLHFALFGKTQAGWLKKYFEFINFLKKGRDGWLEISFPQLALTLRVKYTDCSKFQPLTYLWKEGVHAGKFKVKFREPALLYEGIVAANVGPRRARRHAGRNLALVGVEAEHVEAARLEAGPASDAFVLIDNVDHVLSPWRSPRRGGRLCEG